MEQMISNRMACVGAVFRTNHALVTATADPLTRAGLCGVSGALAKAHVAVRVSNDDTEPVQKRATAWDRRLKAHPA